MTWNEIKLNLKRLDDFEIANKFRSFIYTKEKLKISDATIGNWAAGRFNPSGQYTLLLKEFFEKMEKNEIV
jgi:hypothetical protein